MLTIRTNNHATDKILSVFIISSLLRGLSVDGTIPVKTLKLREGRDVAVTLGMADAHMEQLDRVDIAGEFNLIRGEFSHNERRLSNRVNSRKEAGRYRSDGTLEKSSGEGTPAL